MLNDDVRVLLSISGKGGVGKTLQTIGLSAALAKVAKVGALDLDIRSPNLTYVLGIGNSVEIDDEGHPLPKYVTLDGSMIPVFSSAMMFGDSTAILLEGKQMRNLISGMLYQVAWPALDYLVVDMDPSSGDSLIQITNVMKDVSAFVITTSDISSIQDCRRMLDACRHLGVRVNGIVGNMIGVECPHCGHPLVCNNCHEEVTFGDEEPIRKLAEEYSVPYLGALPWNPLYRTNPVASVQGIGAALFSKLVASVREVIV